MRLDYQFQNPDLLAQACTHSSLSNETPGIPNNERLEFLGDAVVQLVITQLLVERFPSWPEGDLSKARSRLVREDSLAQLAREIELGSSLRLGSGEHKTRGFDKDRVLADALEALIGAIYLDGGLFEAQRVLRSLVQSALERVLQGPLRDVRGALQELAQARGWSLPDYQIVHASGPDHARTYTAQVTVGQQTFGPGSGTSKKAAFEVAAGLALQAIPDICFPALPENVE